MFISQEMAPYVSGTEMAEFCRDLPQAMQKSGFEVRTFMPKYGTVNERRNMVHEVIRLSNVNICINDNDHPLIIKVASLQPSRIQVYFTDNDDYFLKEESDIDAVGSNRADNDERALFFAHGMSNTVLKLQWEPAVMHVIGWMSALAPIYLRRMFASDEAYSKTKVVYSIAPGEMTAPVDEKIFDKLLEDGFKEEEIAEFRGLPLDTDLFHRMAIKFADAVVVQDPEANPELIAYAESLGKPVSRHNPEDKAFKEYADLYHSLSDEE